MGSQSIAQNTFKFPHFITVQFTLNTHVKNGLLSRLQVTLVALFRFATLRINRWYATS